MSRWGEGEGDYTITKPPRDHVLNINQVKWQYVMPLGCVELSWATTHDEKCDTVLCGYEGWRIWLDRREICWLSRHRKFAARRSAIGDAQSLKSAVPPKIRRDEVREI